MIPDRLPDTQFYYCSHEEFFSDDPFDLVSVVYTDNYAIGMHMHNFYELNFITGGEGVHYIEQQKLTVHRGDIFVIPPRVAHGYYQLHSLRVHHLLLHQRFIELYKEQLQSMSGFLSLFSIEPALRACSTGQRLFLSLDDAKLEEVIERLDSLHTVQHDSAYKGHYILAHAQAIELLSLLSRWYQPYGSGTAEMSQLHYREIIQSVEDIQVNYAEKLSVKELAQQHGLSVATFLRAFQNLMRCTPGQYIISQRVQHAKELLTSSVYSITDIAQRCGFYDSSHFVRFFTREEGVSPREYRKAAENGSSN